MDALQWSESLYNQRICHMRLAWAVAQLMLYRNLFSSTWLLEMSHFVALTIAAANRKDKQYKFIYPLLMRFFPALLSNGTVHCLLHERFSTADASLKRREKESLCTQSGWNNVNTEHNWIMWKIDIYYSCCESRLFFLRRMKKFFFLPQNLWLNVSRFESIYL